MSNPVIASVNCCCPLPATPAIPRISPPRMEKLTWSSTGLPPPMGRTTTSLASTMTSPGLKGPLSKEKRMSRPTIILARSCTRLIDFVLQVDTLLPLLRTCTVWLNSMTSSILWVMKMALFPSASIFFRISFKSRDSPGVSTAVGSSRMRMSAPRYNSLRISTRCCSPTDRSWMILSGYTCKP